VPAFIPGIRDEGAREEKKDKSKKTKGAELRSQEGLGKSEESYSIYKKIQ
jgi:hypothetical protein